MATAYALPQHPVYAAYVYSSPRLVLPPQPMCAGLTYLSTPVQQQQQPMSQYRAATPVLYDSTPMRITYGLPHNAQTISTLADGGVNVSHLGFDYAGESGQEEFDAFE